MESPQRPTTPHQGHHRNRSLSPTQRPAGGNTVIEDNLYGETVTLTVDQTEDGHLGFSVRGGAEHGLNIFISKVESNSAAEQAGLCVGDKLLEVNGISLENISMSSAVNVMTGHRRLRLVLQRVGRVPGVRYTNEKTTWVDLIHRRMVVEEGGVSQTESRRDGALCRTVHLHTSLSEPCLGLNIRGGTEYGLGIYVSKLDPGGLAEQAGIKMGDQILSANGVSFVDITHGRAVEVLKSQNHLTLTIKEAGRYPAYQELVAEYSWLNKRSSRALHSSSRMSNSFSSASSLSSGTPLGSVAGLSQATLPLSLPLRSQMSDQSGFTEGQFTDLIENDFHTETSLSRGPTELLQDSPIRNDEGDGAGRDERREGRKTSLLMALSRPGPPVRRTQSHMTVSEEEQRKQKEGREHSGISLQRSKTFLGLLWKRSTSTERSKSPSPNEPGQGTTSSSMSDQEVLTQVEDMASKLLEEEDIAVLVEICKRYTVERELKSLVLPLLAILDGPEKLLLLREIRMLVPKEDLQQFNSMVKPLEEEAYDILKRRSRQSSPLRSPKAGHAPKRHLITPVPDQQGGFELQAAEDVDRQNRLLQQLQRLRAASQMQSQREEPSRVSFTPLLDIPVDSCSHIESLKPSRSRSPTIPNWLLTQESHSPVSTTDNEFGPSLENPTSSRGRSPFRNGCMESKAGRDVFFTVVDTPRHKRPLLSQVFGPLRRSHSTAGPSMGHSGENQVEEHSNYQEYQLKMVCISKTKRSLGISISGGIESRVQPVVKIEKIFPGGAASTSNMLKAGFELVSVDGVSLQGITHQDAVEIIRQAFSNKHIDPMELVVKVPKHS